MKTKEENRPAKGAIHNLCKLPKGYRWMKPFENFTSKVKYTKPTSPKWHTLFADDSEVFGSFNPKAHFPHAIPIETENKIKKLKDRVGVFRVSIDDGYVEYEYFVKAGGDKSIHDVYVSLCKSLNIMPVNEGERRKP